METAAMAGKPTSSETQSEVKRIRVLLPAPHAHQRAFINSQAKRRIIRAGRRGGKTVGVAILAVQRFLAGGRVLYAAPTTEQVGRFWAEVTKALASGVAAGLWRQNVTEHVIEAPGTEQRIRAKTAWNADTLRGDYASMLILDEWQLMDESAWEEVGAPMLLDNNGDAVFIYTPPSLRSRSVSKARDPQHAAKMYAAAKADTTGRWATFHFGSADNPHISREALAEIAQDMTALAYRQEILAEDVTEAPGALWTRDGIERNRVKAAPDDLTRIAVGLDPSVTSTGDDAGIIVAALAADGHAYVLADATIQGSPAQWAAAAVYAAQEWGADRIVAERNQGGEMVKSTILAADPRAVVSLVHASRGKAVRADPISARSEHGKVHHVGSLPSLEDELCLWTPLDKDSPNRLDAYVWVLSWLFGLDPAAASDADLLGKCVV